jgi:high affinity Mn2+ porin
MHPLPGKLILLLGLVCLARGATESESVWSIHGQSTLIEDFQPGLSAAYTGPLSLSASQQDAHTITATAFLGRKLWSGGVVYFDPEVTQGTGLSKTLGVAGFPNGEATHASGAALTYTTARLYWRQTFGFGGATEKIDDGQNQLAETVEINRVTLTVGKLSAVDQFDGNAYSHDPRAQFMNWALMDNGAWDYPANTKGYTGGAVVEWNSPHATLRYGVFFEPDYANGYGLDPHWTKAFGQVLEEEVRYDWNGHRGTFRPMVYWNRANMGSYAQALRQTNPDISSVRAYRSKAGAGFSWDQELGRALGVFGRAGWSDGKAETWAFTEIDRSASAGLSAKGMPWHRGEDVLAVAALVNGLSDLHRRYLAAGGLGFIVGDGRLNYATENIVETYYAARLAPEVTMTIGYQWIDHPAYNRDRGPASVLALRLHVEF